MDGIGTGSWEVASFVTISVEHLGCATVLVNIFLLKDLITSNQQNAGKLGMLWSVKLVL
jgi:hypothetical protein